MKIKVLKQKDKDNIKNLIEMLSSNDRDTVDLALSLADEEFGRYQLYSSQWTLKFTNILHFQDNIYNFHYTKFKRRAVFDWLNLALEQNYLYYE